MPPCLSSIDALRKLPAEKIARAVALVCTLLIVAFHVAFATQAGALWRDEVSTLEVATMRTFAELWVNMSFDSFPVFFFLVLRCIARIAGAINDAGLRAFGCGIGLLTIAMMWLNSRWLRLGFPVLTLALVGMNPMIIRYGDSIRAYGLGIALMLFSLGAMWRLAESCTRGRIAIALLAALLSVHTLYYNALLLFAVCMGAVAVTLPARRYLHTLIILGIGALAALSMLAYRSVIARVNATKFIWTVDFTLADLWQNLRDTLGSHCIPAVWLSVGVFVVGISVAGVQLLRQRNERLLFAAVTLLVGVVGYAIFLFVLSYRTRPWYYVVAIAFAGICLEMIFAASGRKRTLFARSAFALLFIGLAAQPTWETLSFRQTNVDTVAAQLERYAEPGDLIVINSFNYAISFQRYYHGRARYQTVPPVEDVRTHRVDLIKQRMMSRDPIRGISNDVVETLRGGGTVWLIGRFDLVPPGQKCLTLLPGYDGPQGWVGGDFFRAWSEQISYLLITHSEAVAACPIPAAQPVMRYENLRLNAIRGWRGASLALQ